MAASNGPTQWRFFRAGGFDQVQLESGDELLALGSLDQKLWVALACPVAGVELDPRTLELIDADHDGFIRAPEVLSALDWVGKRLKRADLVVEGTGAVPLSEIDETTEEGSRLLASAYTILNNLGKAGAGCVTIEDATDTEAIFSRTRFNGDGIVTPFSADDETLAAWITDIIACLGSETDRSGEPGIGGDILLKFDKETEDWLAWRGRIGNDEIAVMGDTPEDTLRLWEEVKGKIEDFFLRCRLAAYDNRAAVAMNPTEEHLAALSSLNLAEAEDSIAALPLSGTNLRHSLHLKEGINPAWQARMERFGSLIAAPILGNTESLSVTQWEMVKEKISVCEGWWNGRPVTPVAALGADRLKEWQNSGVAARLSSLIEQDLAKKAEYEAVVEVEKLARLCRDIFTLINNFVSFRDFYTGRGKAIFQAGTLYLDGRSYDLCVQVKDVAKHALLATYSRVYLLYCDCVRNGSEKMTIAAAVTNGDCDQLMVGRNGVFYDRQGNDWNATIVRIVDHPISIRQAFWAPYKRIGRMVGEQIQKMAAARSKAAEEKAAMALMQTGQKKEDPKSTQQQLFDAGKFAGIFAAIGLAIGAIGTALASVVTGFLRLAWWQMPLAVLGVMLVISGPSIVIAWFKLHQRNLGPILDANGWAVNSRAKLNIPFGASLTELPRLPEGAKQSLADPYAEKRVPWKRWAVLLLLLGLALLAWRHGVIGRYVSCIGR